MARRDGENLWCSCVQQIKTPSERKIIAHMESETKSVPPWEIVRQILHALYGPCMGGTNRFSKQRKFLGKSLQVRIFTVELETLLGQFTRASFVVKMEVEPSEARIIVRVRFRNSV